MLQTNFRKLVYLWFWFHLIKIKCCGRILGIFPILSTSHFNFHAEIMRTLADAGHQVTMVSPWSPPPHQNMTIINSQIGRELDINLLMGAINVKTYWFKNVARSMDCFLEPDCRHVLSMEEIKGLKNFDVMFVEMQPMFECFISLAKKLNIPVVGTSASRLTPFSDAPMGISRNPAVAPNEYTFVNAKMSFYERIINLLEEILLQIIDFMAYERVKRIFEEFPEYSELDPHNFSISLSFVNTHEIFLPQATAPNGVLIGGIGVKSAILNPISKTRKKSPAGSTTKYASGRWILKVLLEGSSSGTNVGRSIINTNSYLQDLEKFVDEADCGVILFSLGTLASYQALPLETLDIIKRTLAKLKQRVIWKHDDDGGRISDNILQIKWVPQKEILAHNKVIAFISHGGLNSIHEAIYFGKPMILLPLFADQQSNAGILNSFEVCICLDILKLNEMVLMKAVTEITDNPPYRKNMENLSRKFKDDIMSPKEKVVYWTEHILRHKGAEYLRWVGTDMPSYQYFLIDIIGFVIVIFTFFIFSLYLSVKCISALVGTSSFKTFKLKYLK